MLRIWVRPQKSRELEAERHRLGVDAAGLPDLRGVLELERAPLERGREGARGPRGGGRAASTQLERENAVSTTSYDVSPRWRKRASSPAPLPSKEREEGDDVVARGGRLDLLDARRVEPAALRGSPRPPTRGSRRRQAIASAAATSTCSQVCVPPLLAPDPSHRGAGVFGDHEHLTRDDSRAEAQALGRVVPAVAGPSTVPTRPRKRTAPPPAAARRPRSPARSRPGSRRAELPAEVDLLPGEVAHARAELSSDSTRPPLMWSLARRSSSSGQPLARHAPDLLEGRAGSPRAESRLVPA